MGLDDRRTELSETPLRVLVIDDNVTMLAAMKHFLEGQTAPSVAVTTAETLAEGMKAVLSQPFGHYDAVLLDWTLSPGLPGIQVHQFRVYLPLGAILAISGADYRLLALQAGADDFVLKSALVKQLLPAILDVLAFKRRNGGTLLG